jgi:acetyl-CoA carboxylase biotin carboxyl carrier protein
MSNKKHNHSDNITLVQKFVDIMNNNNLSELEYESDDVKLKISNKVVNTNSNTSAIINQNPEEKLIQNTPDEKSEKFSHDHQGAVNSPMVGTAYSSSEAGKEPFVKINSSVIKGDTLLIIEAMKVMNIITAHKSGKIIFIGFVDSQPVEYDQTLLIIE